MKQKRTYRTRFVHRSLILLVAFILSALPSSGIPLVPASRPLSAQEPLQELRAFWASSYNDGFRNYRQVDEMVENAVRANVNTLIIQMRRHGDAWYTRSIEPRAADPLLAPAHEFDALDYLIAKGHEQGIKVHAWLVVTVACRRGDPLLGHPDHVCTTHGPSIPDPERWTTATYRGQQVGDLDFGHPSAVHHMESVVENLLRNYPDVDGIHLDFMRYTDQEYGYNRVSVDRFNRAHGLPPNHWPHPSDPAWSQWRRDRMTELMRRIYIRSKAIKPTIQVSVAAITWGGTGSYTPDDWPNSVAYARVFQDWRGWLQEGIIDFALPMHYFEESVPRSRNWYTGWVNWDRMNVGKRTIVVGIGAWLNSPEQNLTQIRQAQEYGSNGVKLGGVSLYAYHNLFVGSNPERRREFMDYLRATVFSQPARAPDWPWIANPTTGMLQGIATIEGEVIPDASIALFREGVWVRDISACADGWYGAVELEPGTYTLLVRAHDGRETRYENVQIWPGMVSYGS